MAKNFGLQLNRNSKHAKTLDILGTQKKSQILNTYVTLFSVGFECGLVIRGKIYIYKIFEQSCHEWFKHVCFFKKAPRQNLESSRLDQQTQYF